jgi:hypothetical protein
MFSHSMLSGYWVIDKHLKVLSEPVAVLSRKHPIQCSGNHLGLLRIISPLLERAIDWKFAVLFLQCPYLVNGDDFTTKPTAWCSRHTPHFNEVPQLDPSSDLRLNQVIALLNGLLRFHSILEPPFESYSKLVRATVIQHSSKLLKCLMAVPVELTVVVKLTHCELLPCFDDRVKRFVNLLASHKLLMSAVLSFNLRPFPRQLSHSPVVWIILIFKFETKFISFLPQPVDQSIDLWNWLVLLRNTPLQLFDLSHDVLHLAMLVKRVLLKLFHRLQFLS